MTEDIVKKDNSQESAYSLMKDGKIDEAVNKLVTASSADEIMLFCNAFKEEVASNKNRVFEIKDRGFFKSLVSNNAKDIGDVLYQQNILLAACFVLLRLNSSNGEVCARMYAELFSKARQSSSLANEESSEIEEAILATIERNAHEHHMNEVRDKAMMKLLKAASESHDFEARMTTALHEAAEEYKSASAKISQEHEQSITNIRQEQTQAIAGIHQEYESKLSALRSEFDLYKQHIGSECSILHSEVQSQKEHFKSELALLEKRLEDQQHNSLQKELLYRHKIKCILWTLGTSSIAATVVAILALVL